MDHDDLTDRLRALGEQPVPEATRHQHLSRMTVTTPAAAPRRFGHFAVAAAAIVGFFAGSTGLAMAGALPDPAQDVAHDVLSTISVQVPEGHRGSCVSAAAKIADPEAKATEKAKCPKGGKPAGVAPGRSGEAPGRSGDAQTKADKHADDPCRGKPPWAGRNDMTEAEKQAAKQQRAAECGRTLDADDPADAAEDAAEREREAAEEQRETDEEQQQQAPAPPPEAPVADAEPAPVVPAQPEPEPEAVEPAPEPES